MKISTRIVWLTILPLISIIVVMGWYLNTNTKASNTKASKQESQVTITNETENLKVVSSTTDANKLFISLANASDKSIIGYHCDTKRKEGIFGDPNTFGELKPKSSFSILIPLDQL